MMVLAVIALAMVSVGSVLRAKRRTLGGLVFSSLGAGLFVGVTAVACTGCPGLPPPDGCTPLHTRCSPKGTPEVCSQTQRWTGVGQPCASVGAVCCRTVSPYGRELYACTRPASCMPDKETDSGDAGEGGAE